MGLDDLKIVLHRVASGPGGPWLAAGDLGQGMTKFFDNWKPELRGR